MTEPIDVMIPLGPQDRNTVVASVLSVRAFIADVRNIYLVSREDPGIPGTRFVPETTFPFDIVAVGDLVGARERAGWYLQQLIKLYFPAARPDCLDRVL